VCSQNREDNELEMRTALSKNDDGSTEIYFVKVSHWDDFDLVVGLLQQENDCQVLSKQEAIYLRVAKIQWNKIEFMVKHDDMLGNFIYTENPHEVPALERLANNVIASIQERLRRVKHNE
jgi:hypothetical protein